MDRLLTRYTAFYLAILGTLTFLVLGLATSAWWLLAALVFAALTVTGILDLRQTRHAIRRNYPVIGNLRFFFESRSEEHTSELQSLMRISYAVFCLKKKKTNNNNHNTTQH